MIGLIARKDFLLNITSVRFIIGFFICLFIIPFTLVVSLDRYNEQQIVSKLNADRAEKELKSSRVYSAVRPEIVRLSEPLSIFSEGINDNLGTSVKIQLGEYPLLLTTSAQSKGNPFLNAFSSIDFATVIAIIMSLLALVFSYDGFTREREDGTLKAVLANKISRTSFYLGKLCGILLTLLPILFFCFLLSILFISIYPNISLSLSNWGSIALLFLSSTLYVILFILLGLFISSVVRRSSTSIIICLLTWIWFLFLIPNIAFYIAKSFTKIDLYDNMQLALHDIDKEFRKEASEKQRDILNQLDMDGISYWNGASGLDGYQEMLGLTADYSCLKYHKLYTPWIEPRRIDYADKKWAVQKKYLDGLVKQEKTRQWFACLSPSEIFGQLSSSLCYTDANAYLLYMNNIREYRETLVRYFKDNKLFESTAYFTSQDLVNFVIPEMTKPMRDYPTLNLDDLPAFTYQPSTTGDILKLALQRASMLLFIGLILLAGTMISFRKYKVQ